MSDINNPLETICFLLNKLSVSELKALEDNIFTMRRSLERAQEQLIANMIKQAQA